MEKEGNVGTDPSLFLLRSLRERITPVVMALTTEAVEESCRKNNISFVDMLRPFCKLHQVDVPVRTASDQPFRLQEFEMRIFHASEINQPGTKVVEEYLLQVVNDYSSDAFKELSGDTDKIENAHEMAQSASTSSWFQRYSKEFTRSLAFSEHEAIDHPVACLLVVSSRDENPINKFIDLFNSDKLPALLNDSAMDPKLLKYFVLLHDNQDGPPDRAGEIWFEMKGTFGASDCRLLSINSGPSDDDASGSLGKDFWMSYMIPNSIFRSSQDSHKPIDDFLPKEKVGSFLSDVDMKEIADCMLNIAAKQLIPYMEQKIRSLNQQVIATRRGLRNQIKNFWWRKGKDETADVASGPMYTFSSMESQIRLLADYAFMLSDYELALSNYRLLASDYKFDKAWMRYAGVQEMIGLSMFMLDQSPKEADSCMEAAFNTYQKLGISGERYSTRCALWWAEMLKAKGLFREAANVYSRAATEETPLRAGILLEQAAYCYLSASPPMLRKYGFNLVLAGNRYNNCDQKKHAVRAFTSVLNVYQGQGWRYISDHVNFNLGRLWAVLGKFDVAIQHFLKLLASSHQSMANQAAFLEEFLHAFQNCNSKRALKLYLPSINMDTVRVYHEDQRTFTLQAMGVFPEKVWTQLEAPLIPSTASNVPNWLDVARRTKPLSLGNDMDKCIAGEDIRVDVELSNPLQIPVDISHVSLICRFLPECHKKTGSVDFSQNNGEVEETHAADLSSGIELSCQISGDEVTSGDMAMSSFMNLSEDSFLLQGGEKVTAHLKVTPLEKGILSVVGIKWVLSNTVTGYQTFEGLKRKRSRGHKLNALKLNPSNQWLSFHVLKQMPKLEASLHGLPQRVNTGELYRLVLELTNASNTALKKIKFNTNHPGVVFPGDLKDLDLEFPNCLEMDKSEQCDELKLEVGNNSSVFSFPEDVVIDGHSTLLWPLWLHAREAGTLVLRNVLYYETESVESDLQFRTLRMSHNLQVDQSLAVSVKITPCVLRPERFLLCLDISNQHSSESFWLRQVSCIGNNWLISPLLPLLESNKISNGSGDSKDVQAAYLSASLCPSQLLPAGQGLSLFFHLENKEVDKSNSIELANSVRLSPPSSSEPLINVNGGPLFRLHSWEQHLQSNHDKESEWNRGMGKQGMIDIILLSEQQDEDVSRRSGALRDNQRLATHHVCNYSIGHSAPVVWVMQGPGIVTHDFSLSPFCEVWVSLTLRNNGSAHTAWVSVETLPANTQTPSNAASSSIGTQQGQKYGWYDLSLEVSNGGVLNEVGGDSVHSEAPSEEEGDNSDTGAYSGVLPCAPYVWCSVSRRKELELESGATTQIPLCVAVFSPGIYDLSTYRVKWRISSAPTTWSTSVPHHGTDSVTMESPAGIGLGHPFLLTVLPNSS